MVVKVIVEMYAALRQLYLVVSHHDNELGEK